MIKLILYILIRLILFYKFLNKKIFKSYEKINFPRSKFEEKIEKTYKNKINE